MGGMTYRIASFNMYQFNFRSDDEIKKDLVLLAKIIRENGFDLVAMQEVLNEAVLKQLIASGLLGWEEKWAQPRYSSANIASNIPTIREKGYSKSKREAEGYAFMWNPKRFVLSWSYKTLADGSREKRIFEPRIYNQYRIDKKSGQQPLARNPYYGKFRPVCAGNPRDVEIRLINTHITYGDSGSAEFRRQEFKVLADQIYRRIHNDRINETESNIPAYTIMLGDYNLNLPRTAERTWVKAPYLTTPGLEHISMEVYTIPDNILQLSSGHQNPVREIRTVQDSLTTLKRIDRENFDLDSPGMANNYDHFSFNSSYLKDGICKDASSVNTVETVKNYYKIDEAEAYDVHRQKVSDHIPIKLDIKL